MKKYPLNNIISAENGILLYTDENGTEKNINLKQSGIIWWEKHHKNPTLADKLFGRKYTCKYIGGKFRSMTDETYIYFWNDTEEIRFVQRVSEQKDNDNYLKTGNKWEDIITQIQKQGFWLFDEG